MLHNTKSLTFNSLQFHLRDVTLKNCMAMKKNASTTYSFFFFFNSLSSISSSFFFCFCFFFFKCYSASDLEVSEMK